MQEITVKETMVKRAKELLADGTVTRVIGWKVFESAEEIDKDFVYDGFCAANVSKYLVKESAKEGKILAFLKPCDTFSLNQLTAEHRVNRDNIYVIGIP